MNRFLIQHKQAGKESHTVKRKDLEILRKHAIHANREPVYIFEYDEGKHTYYIIDEELFSELRRD